MRRPAFCLCENRDADRLRGNREADQRVTAELVGAFVFATRIVQSLYFLNPKFQASNHLLSQYRLVCVGPGRRPRRPVFSERDSMSPCCPGACTCAWLGGVYCTARFIVGPVGNHP